MRSSISRAAGIIPSAERRVRVAAGQVLDRPVGRLGQPKDIMGLAVFLASDSSEWITGAIIPMDGGNMAMNAGGTPGHEQRVVQTFRAEAR